MTKNCWKGRPFAYIVDSRDCAALTTATDELRAAQTHSATMDLRLRRLDGGTVPFALTFTDLLEDPTIQGIVVIGHDISDRVTAENELGEAHSLLAMTLESTADGILVVDETGKIASVRGSSSPGSCRTRSWGRPRATRCSVKNGCAHA